MRKFGKVCLFLFIGGLLVIGATGSCRAASGFTQVDATTFSFVEPSSDAVTLNISNGRVFGDYTLDYTITSTGPTITGSVSSGLAANISVPDSFTISFALEGVTSAPLSSGVSAPNSIQVSWGGLIIAPPAPIAFWAASASAVANVTSPVPIPAPALLLGSGLLGLIGFGARRRRLA